MRKEIFELKLLQQSLTTKYELSFKQRHFVQNNKIFTTVTYLFLQDEISRARAS